MSVTRLRHAVTQAVISVEVPPTGLSPSYERAGWEDIGPEPEPKPKARKQPAEPVNPEPANAPDESIKE